MNIDTILERDILPDAVLRFGIRRLLRQRLLSEHRGGIEQRQEHLERLIGQLKTGPIAVNTLDANQQHYEVPAEFFRLVLGPHMKYSSGYWKSDASTLEESERDMLDLTCRRAELNNAMDILELGCGWGSLTLFMAERYPDSRITAVSNSRTQKKYIDARARELNLRNVTVITADMNIFTLDRQFDRIVSVEMFEHMRNYRALLERVAGMMKDDGKLFVHIFTHREYTYLFEVQNEHDWMSKYFFTGGIMPGDHLLFYFNDHVCVERHWRVSGLHYRKTSEAWLRNMDTNQGKILPLFRSTYGNDRAGIWWVYWRVFFMACAELWGYRNGEEWFVSHYLFRKA
jgi:cyclopropane-fatty-acyl-phospholipid synthase